MPDKAKTLGEFRRDTGMTQAELSEKSGIKLSTIQKLERDSGKGIRSIGRAQLDTVLPLARSLGVTVEELAGY